MDLMNTELISLNNWFKSNKLLLNTTKKSFFMIFHISRIETNSIGSIIIDNSKLIKVDYKYLGVIIDHKLNWIELIANLLM